ADGRLCPAGTQCDIEHALCVVDDQRTACDGASDGAACQFGAQVGTCDLGVCIPASCGNGVVGPDEVCDDGNTVSGDGCRADCKKIEVCGDGEIDAGEDCDDANDNAADGCDMCVATSWHATAVVGGALVPTEVPLAPDVLAIDAYDRLYIGNTIFTDLRLYRLAAGELIAVAGNGETGFTGDDGLAPYARLETT